MKCCTKCGIEKSESAFSKNGYKGGLHSWCKSCCSKYNSQKLRERRLVDPFYDFAKNLKKNYGMTVEEYNSKFEKQNGLCAICGGVNKDGRNLFVDHNHQNGKTRDLLCHNCNAVIGLAGEDEKRLLLISLYLRRHRDDR